MHKLIFFCFLFSALSVCAQTKVMTYNIRNSHAADGVNAWSKRRDALAALIKKVNPDILGVQEAYTNQVKDLKARLKEYKYFGVGRNNGKNAGERSAVFFKEQKYTQLDGGNFWLSTTPGVPGSKSWDAALTRICTWVKLQEKATGKIFFVFNTHFDHKGVQARNNSAELIRHYVDSLAGDNPVMVIGDFNSTPKDLAYQTMVTPGNHKVTFNDSYSSDMPDFTDCGFNVSNTHCNRIDYIFYSQRYTKSHYTLYNDNNGTYYPSDHLTISAELRLR